MSVNRARPRKGAPARAPRGRPRRAAARTVPPKRPLSALRLLLLPGSEPLDLLGERHQAPRLLDMQPFDQPAVDERNAKTPGGRLGMRGDDLSRPRDLVPAGGEGRIGRPDLLGMDQRLAVKSELPALPARKGKTLLVAKVKMDAIEHGQPVAAPGQQNKTERGHQRHALAGCNGVQILGPIAGAARMPSGVSSMHQIARPSGAPSASSSDAVRHTRSGFSTLGSNTASIGMVAAAARSPWPHGLSSGLTRSTHSRRP